MESSEQQAQLTVAMSKQPEATFKDLPGQSFPASAIITMTLTGLGQAPFPHIVNKGLSAAWKVQVKSRTTGLLNGSGKEYLPLQ